MGEVLCPRPGLDGNELRATFVNMLPLFSSAVEVRGRACALLFTSRCACICACA